MSVHVMKSATTAQRSPARQALAMALADKSKADARLEAQHGAVARAERLVADAESELAAAVEAIGRAREQQGLAVAKAVAAGSRPPASALRAARAAELEATDACEAANNALAHIREQSEAMAEEAERAGKTVEISINAVLALEAREHVASVIRCREKLIELLSVSAFLQSRGRERQGQTSSFRIVPELSRPLAGIEVELATALENGVPLSNNIELALGHPILERWRDVVAALRGDPDTPLPGA